MSHVKIRFGAGTPVVEVDGVDIARHIMRDGFGIDFSSVPDYPAEVSMVVAANSLEVDLPDAVIKAMRAELGDED